MSNLFNEASLVLVPSGYKAGKVYSQVPTNGSGDLSFTRALDTATRVGSDGLIEKVRTNLVLQSQTFDDAGWSKQNVTITANDTTSPDGLTDADTVTKVGSSANERVRQSLTLSTTSTVVFSCYVKNIDVAGFSTLAIRDSELSRIRLHWSGAELNTVTVEAGIVTNFGFSDAGNDWYRVFITVAVDQVSLTLDIDVDRGNAADTTSIAVWGAQLETGDIATPYIPTTTAAVSVGMLANVPRLDYTGGGCPKLLLEPQRSNLITFSEQIDNAAYTNTEATTINANVGTSPDGFEGADKLIPQATSNFHRIARSFTTIALTPHAFSIFVKRDGYDFFLIRVGEATNNNVGFDLVNGIVTFVASGFTAFIESYGNDWYRVGFVRTFTITAPSIRFRPQPTATTDNNIANFTGDGTSGALVWGAQLEEASYATSYIPTLGAAVTRSADAASKTGISDLIGQTEGTIFAEVNISRLLGATTRNMLTIGTAFNFVRILFTSLSANRLRFLVRTSSITRYEAVLDYSTLETLKLAIAYKSADTVAFVNGVEVTSIINNAFTLTTINDIVLGETLQDSVSQALLFKTRLTNAQLEELTTL